MDAVIFRCPCNITLQAERQMVGKKVQCANCGTVVIVPSPSGEEAPAPARAANHAVNAGNVQVMKWFEPSIMKRTGSKTFNLWISVALILGMGVVGVILRSVMKQGDHPRSYGVVFLGCAAVGVVFDLLRRILLFIPSAVIIVSPQGINRNTMMGNVAHLAFWPWHTIGSGKVEVVALGSKSVRLLTLYSYDQQEIGTLGMSRSASFDQLAEAFSAMGKPLR